MNTSTKLMTAKSAAALLGLQSTTLVRWRHLRKGPRYVKVGGAVRYREADLVDFINSGEVDHERAE
jgi:predicted DNA-binding transcriptional regulator AlpA